MGEKKKKGNTKHLLPLSCSLGLHRASLGGGDKMGEAGMRCMCETECVCVGVCGDGDGGVSLARGG